MKHPIELEPNLRFMINKKIAKRGKWKKYRKIHSRLFRRKMNQDPINFDVYQLKRRIDYEF